MSDRTERSAENNPGSGTSLTLLDRVRASDQEAWRRLVHLYSPLVYSWARRTGLGDTDSADLLQQVWQAVAGSMERFQRDVDRGTFRGWLWTITRNRIRDHLRTERDKPHAAGGTDAGQLLQNVPDPQSIDESREDDHRLFHAALELIRAEFEERTWQAFWGTAVDGRSAADVGAEVGLAANAVYQAKFRVLKRLRQEMAGLIEECLPSSAV